MPQSRAIQPAAVRIMCMEPVTSPAAPWKSSSGIVESPIRHRSSADRDCGLGRQQFVRGGESECGEPPVGEKRVALKRADLRAARGPLGRARWAEEGERGNGEQGGEVGRAAVVADEEAGGGDAGGEIGWVKAAEGARFAPVAAVFLGGADGR